MDQHEGRFFLEIGQRFENRIKYLDSNRKDHTYFAIDFHLWRCGDEEGTNRNGKYFITLQKVSDFIDGERNALTIRQGNQTYEKFVNKVANKISKHYKPDKGEDLRIVVFYGSQ